MKLEYIRNGDYYIPNLTIQKEERSIGKWVFSSISLH